jgi:predicted acyl esterase
VTRFWTRVVSVAFALLVVAPSLPAQALAPRTAAKTPDDRLGQNAPYTFTTRDFWIDAPDPDDMGNPVKLDARLLVPNGKGPFAGMLINHGYLGDKGGDGDTAEAAARHGYIVLRYSSRGFGQTKGQVDLVGTKETHDMLAAIHWLNNPRNVPIWVDHIAHYGGSYGGAHDLQLALQNDPAVKALVAAATWTDLYDGLLPNNVLKVTYENGFYAAGRARTDGYNNYATEMDVMQAKVESGVDLDGVHALLKEHSITGKWDQVHTPIFLVQGLNDGLFDGNEAIQNFQELRKRHVPVRLYLGGVGHPPATGSGGPEIAHLNDEVNAFLDHYVRGIQNGIDKQPPIEFAPTKYFDNKFLNQDRTANAFPFGVSHALNICPGAPGTGSLQVASCPGAAPALLAAGTGGDPTSEPVGGRAIGNGFQQQFGKPFPSAATPVDVVNLDSPALTADTLYAGIPSLQLQVLSDPPATGVGGPTLPAATFQVDPKLYDVAPDGTATLITRGAYAEQPGQGAPGVHTAAFDAFAFAWSFPAGHRIRLSLSSADIGYLKPNPTAFQVAILPGSQLQLPGAELTNKGNCPADTYPALGPGHFGGYFHVATDCTLLRWQVVTPDAKKFGPGPYPTVIDYSGYEPSTIFFDGLKNTFLDQGYAVAGVNIRGTACSGGKFDYFEPTEWQDGADAVEFLAKGPWSNGDLAFVGKSYPGITPMYVASVEGQNPDSHLRAIVPGAFFTDLYRDVAYPGGIPNAVFGAGFGLVSQPGNTFDQTFAGITGLDQTCIQNQALHAANPALNPTVQGSEHPYDDSFYQQRSNIDLLKNVRAPVLAELAWQDEELAARAINLVNNLPATTPWRAVLQNGDHGEYYGKTVLPEIFRFLNFYLRKSVPAGDKCPATSGYAAALRCYQAEPRVLVNSDLGPDRGATFQTRYASWPVTNRVDRLYLHSGGVMDHSPARPGDAAVTYNYTPGTGSNSYGDTTLTSSQLPYVDYWQTRPPADEIATFTTPAFTADSVYVGTGSLDLNFASTMPDTDLEAMLTELRPYGHGGWQEEYVQKGWLRASHRMEANSATCASDPKTCSTPLRPYQTHQLGDIAPLVPQQPTAMRLEIFPFGQVIRKGNRLRLTIEAPTLKPELWGFEALPGPALNTIFTDALHASSLALPIVPVTRGTTFPAERACGTIRNQPCRPEPQPSQAAPAVPATLPASVPSILMRMVGLH